MKREKAVFFDFDGVIINNFLYILNSFREFIKKKVGIDDIDEEDKEFFLSNPLEKTIVYLKDKYRIEIKGDKKEAREYLSKILFEKEKRFLKEYEKEEYFKELKELLTKLKESGFYLAIISNSLKYRILDTINFLKISCFFDEVLAAEDLIEYKGKIGYLKQIKPKFSEIFLIDDSIKIIEEYRKCNECEGIKVIFFFNPIRYKKNILEEAKKEEKENKDNLFVAENWKEIEKILFKS